MSRFSLFVASAKRTITDPMNLNLSFNGSRRTSWTAVNIRAFHNKPMQGNQPPAKAGKSALRWIKPARRLFLVSLSSNRFE
jgi:hypothetical protein